MDHIPAQREGKAVLGRFPPRSQVRAQSQALVLIGQLSLMDDETDIRVTLLDRLEDAIEGDDAQVELRCLLSKKELKGEECAGHQSRHRDTLICDLFTIQRSSRNKHGSVSITHARTTRKE